MHFSAELQALFLKEKAPKSLTDFCGKMAVEEVVDLAMLAPCDAEVQTRILDAAGIGAGPDATRSRRVWFKARLVYEAALRGVVGERHPKSEGSSLPERSAPGERAGVYEDLADEHEEQGPDTSQSDSEGSGDCGREAGESAQPGEGTRGRAESESPTFDQEEQESESSESENDEVSESESGRVTPPWRKRRAVVVLKPNKRWRRY